MVSVLIAAASPLGMLGFSVLIGLLSVGMIFTGRQAIKTKTAYARRLESVWADADGKIHGTMAVVKGYVLLLGGIVLLLMYLALFVMGVYTLIFGPINLGN